MNLNRLIAIGLLAGCAAAFAGAQLPQSPMPLLPDAFQWHDVPQNPQLRAAWVVGAESHKGPYLMRVMLAKGGKIPVHTHPDERNSTVLSGTLYVGFGDVDDESKVVAIPAGGVYVASANVPHYVWARDGDVIYQESGFGPTGTTMGPAQH